MSKKRTPKSCGFASKGIPKVKKECTVLPQECPAYYFRGIAIDTAPLPKYNDFEKTVENKNGWYDSAVLSAVTGIRMAGMAETGRGTIYERLAEI